MKTYCEECGRETIFNEVSFERYNKVIDDALGNEMSFMDKILWKSLKISNFDSISRSIVGLHFYECECCGTPMVVCSDGTSSQMPISFLRYSNMKSSGEFLLSENFSNDPSEYDKNILKIKNFYFTPIIKNLDDLIIIAGRCYNDIVSYNVRMGKWNDPSKFDHTLIYFLSAWIFENRNYDFLEYSSKEYLAEKITNNIFAYLHYCGKF